MGALKIFVDGSGKYGAYCYLVDGGKPRIFLKGHLTNNQAEYKAIIAALQELPGKELAIHSDSQLAVRQLNGEYQIKDPQLRGLADQVLMLCENRLVTFRWIPREENLAGKVLEKLV